MQFDATDTVEIDLNDILSRIAVRKPYFALQHLQQAGSGELLAPVNREQPMGAERGVMAAAEIGRHLAILGSCAAARQNSNAEQHYYLACHAVLKQVPDELEDLPPGNLVGRAKAEFVDERTAKARAYLIHQATGTTLHQLDVEYQVLRKKLFEKTFSTRRVETPDVKFNPYACDALELGDVFVLDDLLSANLGCLDESTCAGHFPNFPALPVAILAKILIDAAGRLFANVVGIENAYYHVVKADVGSKNLAFTDDKLHLVIQYKTEESDSRNYVFRCRALAETTEQHPFGDLTIILRPATNTAISMLAMP